MNPELSIATLQARRAAKLAELAGVGPVPEGSLAEIGVRCGNPSCRCARGEKHRSHILKRQVAGKTQSLYVPVGLVGEAKQWVAEYRRAKGLLKEISELSRALIRAHVQAKRAAPPGPDGGGRRPRR